MLYYRSPSLPRTYLEMIEPTHNLQIVGRLVALLHLHAQEEQWRRTVGCDRRLASHFIRHLIEDVHQGGWAHDGRHNTISARSPLNISPPFRNRSPIHTRAAFATTESSVGQSATAIQSTRIPPHRAVARAARRSWANGSYFV